MKKRPGIREGFRRQRLVVLPPAIAARLGQHALLRDLLVTDAGVFPHAEGHLVDRPGGAATTLVLVCLAGAGWVQFDQEAPQPVGPGALVWLPAHRAHTYGANGDDAWTIEWAHFSGAGTEAWRQLLDVSPGGGVRHLPASAAGALRLGDVWAHLEHGYTLVHLVAASAALRRSLAEAAACLSRPDTGGDPQQRVGVTLERMRERLRQPVRLAELAALAGLSVPHYCVLFRRRMGFSPVDWFNRLRIKRACELLDTTRLPIRAIAAEVGFEDAYYFTRSFRRVMGRSPRAYRDIAKG